MLLQNLDPAYLFQSHSLPPSPTWYSKLQGKLFSDIPSEFFITPFLFLNTLPFSSFWKSIYSSIQAQIKHHLREAFPNPQNEWSHSLLYTFIAPLTKLFYGLFILCGDCLWVYLSQSLSYSSLHPSFSYPPSTSQLIAWYLEHSKATNMYWALRLLLNICWINEGNT